MYMLNVWWFLSSGGSYPPVFMVALWYTKDTLATRVVNFSVPNFPRLPISN